MTADLPPFATTPPPQWPLSRQARRHAERQQAKVRAAGTSSPKLVVDPAVRAIAAAVPLRTIAELQNHPHKVPLAISDHAITNLDVACWHEAGHAVAMLAGGLHLFFVRVTPAPPEKADRAPDFWEGRCQPYGPGVMTRDAIHRAVAVGIVAGPLAASTVLTGLGLVRHVPHPAEARNSGDDATLQIALDVLGVAPSAVAAFEEQVRAAAFTLLYRHRQQFGALVAGLLAHQALNPSEILTTWRRGAFDFQGRVLNLPHCIDGPEALADPTSRRILRERFGCTWEAQIPDLMDIAATLRS